MSKSTFYLQACKNVPGFRAMGEEFMRKLVINGRGKSTHENYLRQMAKLSLYYKQTPLKLRIDQLEEYLYHLVQADTESKSSFKHLIYGLRKLYYLFDKGHLHLLLPSIKRVDKKPVVLSLQEMKRLLKAPARLWVKVMFGLIYDTGLRISELRNLLISDIDLERGQLHVRKSKNHNDRYISMSSHAVRGIRKHLALNRPKDYLFESPVRKGIPISESQIRVLLKEALKKAGINKQTCVHSLRHTYATHQLEAGQNILVLKESLGHVHIQTTLMYLHIAQLGTVKKFGCLEVLYKKENGASC